MISSFCGEERMPRRITGKVGFSSLVDLPPFDRVDRFLFLEDWLVVLIFLFDELRDGKNLARF